METAQPVKWNRLAIVTSILSLIQIPIYILVIRLMMDVKALVTIAVFVIPVITIGLLILNIIASRQVKKKGEKGKGIAIAGIVLSSISTLLVFMYATTVILFLTSE
jgi:hypothetical protein